MNSFVIVGVYDILKFYILVNNNQIFTQTKFSQPHSTSDSPQPTTTNSTVSSSSQTINPFTFHKEYPGFSRLTKFLHKPLRFPSSVS